VHSYLSDYLAARNVRAFEDRGFDTLAGMGRGFVFGTVTAACQTLLAIVTICPTTSASS
jgi:hypothetical protein